jgi:integrative and conjugative element protein (TIGR02256 family)
VLLGYWAQHPSAPVITAAIGPGPRAVHEKHRFVPDYDYHEQEIARQYLLADGALQYLGDWHTHPGQAGDLSTKDYTTLARIAYSRRARAPQALMLILAHGPRWGPVLWRARKKKQLFYWRPCEVDQLTILRFTPD